MQVNYVGQNYVGHNYIVLHRYNVIPNHGKLLPLAPGTELEPCAAAIDADGCLEWVAIPVGNASSWLRPSSPRAQADDAGRGASHSSALDETLRAHRQLLREPHHFLGWLPVYDQDDEELLIRI